MSVERDIPKILDARMVYEHKIEKIPFKNLVCLDETGFNIHPTNKYGYSA